MNKRNAYVFAESFPVITYGLLFVETGDHIIIIESYSLLELSIMSDV